MECLCLCRHCSNTQKAFQLQRHPSYLCEFVEGSISWVVGDQEAHTLVSNLHWSGTVHSGKKTVGAKKFKLRNVSQQKTLKEITKVSGD